MYRTVLVVDDSGLIRTQLRRALEAANFSGVEAEDGEQAWEVLPFKAELVVAPITKLLSNA